MVSVRYGIGTNQVGCMFIKKNTHTQNTKHNVMLAACFVTYPKTQKDEIDNLI